MKRILYILLLCFPFALSAQNWQNICSPGVTLYQNSGGEIQAFRLDSIQVPGNGDTIFYSYHTIRETQPCADTSHGSVLGFKVYKTSNGWFYFFNKSWDTLKINTNASLSDSWKFCNLPDSGFVEATVSEIVTDTILGMADSVKTILFQAYDSTGNVLTHVINGRTVSLSKSHGMTVMAEVYLLPGAFSKYKLAGTTIPEAGIPNLNERLVYDFNVGDEFHYQGADTYQTGHVTWTYWKRIITILSKQISATGNAFIYQAKRCTHLDIVPPFTWGPPYVENYHDTIILVFPRSSSITDTSRLKLPGTFFRNDFSVAANNYLRDFNGPNNRQRQIIRKNFYRCQDSCWLPEQAYRGWNEYAEGIGCLFDGWGVEYTTVGLRMFYEDKLVYYRKGDEEWGTRLAADCDQLLGTDELQVSGSWFQVFLYPNPLHNQMTLTIEGFKPGIRTDFILYDFLGREVYQTVIRQNEVTLNRPPIPNGLYIWKVTGDLGTATGKLVLE